MKKNLFIGFTLFSMLFFVSCGKEDPQPTDASLKLTVLSSIGNPVGSADVYLYQNLSDYTENQNVVKTGTTDANGVANFTGLELTKYYWRVESECENNDDGGVTTVDNLSAGENTLSVVLAAKPNYITVSSYYDEIYEVYIDGAYKQDIAAQGFAYFTAPNGTYTITLKEKNYVFTQYEYEKTTTVSCGDEITLDFQ